MKIKSSKGEILTVPDGMEEAAFKAQAEGKLKEFADGLKERMKSGGMIKRKDGSYSRRGLWDNIRANRGSGRKPTKEMLRQEAKIRAKEAAGGVVYEGKVTDWTPGEAVPWHTSTIGEKMGKGGYTVKRSSARKGKTHVVIGPDGTKKYFGDSKLGQHPGNPKRKKAFYARHAKNLRKNPYFRAFARATWDDGGKLTDNIYDLGLMPYQAGGMTTQPSYMYSTVSHSVAPRYEYGGMLPSGLIDIPYGYETPAYNERYQMGKGGFYSKVGNLLGDAGKAVTDTVLSTVGKTLNIDALQDVVPDSAYKTAAFDKASNVAGGIGSIASAGTKFVPGLNLIAGAAGGIGAAVDKIAGIDKRYYNPLEHQSGFEKVGNKIGQAADIAGLFMGNPSGLLGGGIKLGAKAADIFGKIGKGASLANLGIGTAETLKSGKIDPMQMAQLGLGAYNISKGGFFSGTPISGAESTAGMGGGSPFGTKRYGGYVRMADGGQAGLVPINVEGADFSEGSGPDARKGELLALRGKIYKNYVGRPPHPSEGQDPMGNDDAPEGLIVIPKARTKEYLEAGLVKRQQIERSLVSQQREREMKKSRQMGDGGYYSFGMGEMGMEYGGPIGNRDRIRSLEEWGGPTAYKKGGWIQKVTASIKRRGTEGVCTGSKFGSSSCPPGSRRYNLAKTFRKMAKARKHEHGGFIDPVTGSHDVMYGMGGNIHSNLLYGRAVSNKFAEGGQLPESLLRTRMRASGASQEEINDYVAAHYGYGGMTYGEGGKLPSGILRARMEASGKSDSAIQNYMSRYYKKEGGPTVHDFPTMGIKYMYGGRAMAEDGMVTGAPYADTYSGPTMGADLGWSNPPVSTNPNVDLPSFYSLPATQTSNVTVPYRDWSSVPGTPLPSWMLPENAYTPNYSSIGLGTIYDTAKAKVDAQNAPPVEWMQKTAGATRNMPYRMDKTSTPLNINKGAALQDLASLAPTLFNLGRYAFEKPDLLNALDYMTPEMKFRATKFDPTPYDYATSRALYNANMGLAGRTALASGMAQARSQGFLDWMNKEYLRRQGVDEANLGINARNKAMQYQIALQNQQAKARRKDFLGEAATQFAQEFGRNPRYYEAIAGDKAAYRQPFTGWKSNV